MGRNAINTEPYNQWILMYHSALLCVTVYLVPFNGRKFNAACSYSFGNIDYFAGSGGYTTLRTHFSENYPYSPLFRLSNCTKPAVQWPVPLKSRRRPARIRSAATKDQLSER